MMSVYHAKKRFGQNFLKSDSIIEKIVEQLNIISSDKIIEIGPGRGALTLKIAATQAEVTAVEFDKDLIGYLSKLLKNYNNVRIVNEDFLQYRPVWDKFKIIGNLPYNITSPVIDRIVTYSDRIDTAVFMVQKEMADRLSSSPGNKDWAPISIFTQLHFEIEKCFDVSPKHFSPPPKVTSAVIRLKPSSKYEVGNYQIFEKIVRESFRHRRKQLINNLWPSMIPDKPMAEIVLGEMNLSHDIRAEQLSIEQFLTLTELIKSRNITV